ncbi:MAG: hypothetical protein LBR43_00595 [Spiroplasmataceae bacterium]|jgi:hypothetical protein|nr:hypothetical protein [Spiroplasmataceae bacterium]
MIRLVCKSVIFHSKIDDDLFFKWIKKIKCISEIEGKGDELYLYVNEEKVDERYLREILGLFCRYNIDMKQLKLFLNNDNKPWFFDNKEAFWHEKVFFKY